MPQVWVNGAWTTADPDYAPNVYISATEPSNPIVGTLWYDTSTSILKIYDGANFPPSWVSTNSWYKVEDDQNILASRVFI
jgi:hypothetical protein